LHDTSDKWGWGNLVANGFIEYIDTDEEETAMVAMLLQDLVGVTEAKKKGEAYYSDT
jgi:DNA-directed RNA polymerase II subunit RPB2